MSLFDGPRRRSHRGCAICGERPALQLMIQAREIKEGGNVAQGRTRSRSVRFCMEHGEVTFNNLVHNLELEVREG